VSLDDDLAAWAAAVRLPEAEADAIYQQIVMTPVLAAMPRLDPSWWRDFTAGFAARMIVSTRPARQVA
jgi:hypothetical protein